MGLVHKYAPGAEVCSDLAPGELVEVVAAMVATDPAPMVGASDVTLPRNAVTGAEYRGGNIMRLVSAEVANGYGTGGWAGFKQWLSVGRVVRKGEHGTPIARMNVKKDEHGEVVGSYPAGGRVFHFDQTAELVEAPREAATPLVRDPGEDMADRWSESH